MCRGPNFNALQHCSRQNAFLTACVALQNRLTAVLCHCKDTFGYFFKTQVCSVPSPMHYSTSQGKSHSSLPRVTLQNRLTAVLCHCKDTFGYFFKTQVCSVPSPMHYSTGQGKSAFLTAQSCVAKQADSRLVGHCKDTFGYFFDTQVCSVPSPMHYSTAQGKSAFLTAQSCSAKQADSRLVSLQIDLWVFAHRTGDQ